MHFTNYQCFQISEVYQTSRESGTFECKFRHWSALALRLSGESTIHYNGRKLHAGTNSLLYLPAWQDYVRESTEEELIGIHLLCSEETSIDIEVLYPKDISATIDCFQKILQEWNAKKAGYQHRCNAYLHILLADLAEYTEHTDLTYQQKLIHPGVSYLETHYDDPTLTIPKLAEMCNISDEYFRRLYKTAYGITPHQAITNKRLQKACRMLQTGSFSIEQTATMSGFSNSKYFSTLFQQHLKTTPREYRNSYSLRKP